MPFWQEWALLEGLNEYNRAVASESGDYGDDSSGGFGTAAYSDEDLSSLDYDPRFPSASRGDVMASAEELMALGIQYSSE